MPKVIFMLLSCRSVDMFEPRGLFGREPLLPSQPLHDDGRLRLQEGVQAGGGEHSQVP
jgi:hypothetical protein